MKELSNSLHYAVELLSVITSVNAKEKKPGIPPRPVSLREVVLSVEGMSLHFLEQIARKLRIADMLEVSRGPGGGYVIKKPVSNISIKDLLDADILRHTSKKKEVPPFKISKPLNTQYGMHMGKFYSLKLTDIKGFGKSPIVYRKETK